MQQQTPNQSPSRARWPLIAFICALSFFAGGWMMQGARVDATPSRVASPQLFNEVLGTVSEYFVDSLSREDLYHKATEGLLAELNDPYSSLVEGDDYKQLIEATTGNYGGLGMQIDVRDGWITVVAPLPDTPAERAGLQAGDQVVEVDGKTTQGLKQDEALKVLRGAPGTKIEIKVRRPGLAALLPFSIVRETIHNRSVQPGTMLQGSTGIVVLNPVSETSASELKEEINNLRKQGMKRLILDLRANPGGLLDQGVAVSDLFLDQGQQIVSTRGRAQGTSKSFADAAAQVWPEMPVVVLVNEYSASAAEIIAGALQDNDRAVVVGTPTFGKGLVQSLFRLPPNRALKLTTARWYTPSGRTIQRTAKNEADQVRQVQLQAAGTDSARVDTLPTFKTVGGRTVKGGGGIVPDRIVRADTLTDAEKEFGKALGSDVATYRDALVATAIDAKQKRTVTNEAFVVDDVLRQAVVSRLAAKGVTLSPEAQANGRSLMDEHIAFEVARYVFGRQAELRRRAASDPQVQAAVALLDASPTPAALMQQASRAP